MSSLKLNVAASIEGYYQGSNDIASPRQDFAKRIALALASGTGADQADLVFADTRTLAASTSENLDLAGVLADAFGQTLTMVEVVAILVAPAEGNTNDVLVGGAASNAFAALFGDATDKLVVKPGGLALLAAPGNPAYAVTASTGDILKVANSAGGSSVTYDIVIIGRSA